MKQIVGANIFSQTGTARSWHQRIVASTIMPGGCVNKSFNDAYAGSIKASDDS